MWFKGISYLELWPPFCSAELNHLCNLGSRHHEQASFLQNYFEFGPAVQEKMSFKIISYLRVEPFVQFW